MKHLQHSLTLSLYAALLLFVVAGCGSTEDAWTKSRPKPVQVTGQILLGGKPLSEASVIFFPSHSNGYSASGMTNTDGHFHLTTFRDKDGVDPGDYTVLVDKEVRETLKQSTNEAQGPNVKVKNVVPQKYSNVKTSGLTVTVHEKSPPLTFELTQ